MECHKPKLTTEDTLRLFTDEERRRLVEALVDHPENTVSIQYLAEEVAPGPAASAPGPQKDTVLATLQHHHLPRLDDMGLVESDWRSDTVRYHPDERVERLLEFIRAELE